MTEVKVRTSTSEDYREILNLAAGLPEWFDSDSLQRAIPVDILHQKVFVAESSHSIIGFISLFIAEGRVNIGWLGVSRDRQNQGTGTLLISAAEQFAKQLNIRELATYTLGDSVDYPPYEATRAFYFRKGFEIYQRSKTDNESCPEELRIRKVID